MAKKTSGLYVNRWQRHGRDILYVNDESGERVGKFDLQSKQIYVEKHMKHRRRDFELALNEWRRGTSRTHPAPVTRSVGQPGRPRDLVEQRAGDGLVAVAQQRRIQNKGLRVLAKILRVKDGSESWLQGAEGERRVGRKLDKLEKHGWQVLHNVQLPGGGDVDHLAIGPAGVIAVNTKYHRNATIKIRGGELVVNGKPKTYAAASRREATRVAEVLHRNGLYVNVAPLIVSYGHARLSGWWWRRPGGVSVVPSWALRRRLRLLGRGRPVLDPEAVARVFAVARRSESWQRA